MGESPARARLAADLADRDLVEYFYLDRTAEDVLDRLDGLRVELSASQDDVPFNAQVKGYRGALDEDGHPWILKPVATPMEVLYHRLCALVHLMDHETGTLSAPTTVFRIDGKPYRAVKVVRKAVQISSYDYLRGPFIDILRADLVNRWIYYDEDRNPNNYLVITNSRNRPFVAAIDFDQADLSTEDIKIRGNPDRFGWFRTEKTRFLTLLRPENFDGVSLEVFEPRLEAMAAIPESRIALWALRLARGYALDPERAAAGAAANLVRRREYVDGYFRSMFKTAALTENVGHDQDYSMFGKSFRDIHGNEK
ncbi:MAG TPA: hypothetical protein VLH39_01435 [Magnetospirillaceae bacterium]|nr:hypothetical protein [Magnetospirillaceae bacterium]